MSKSFSYEDEFFQLKSELRFISYAVEYSFAGMADAGEHKDIADEISYGFCLCFRKAIERLERIEQHAVTEF